jgi:glyceraldehyde-3-phosphate dehydrogenase/erythrose-4-phosphate dehydrogenase
MYVIKRALMTTVHSYTNDQKIHRSRCGGV